MADFDYSDTPRESVFERLKHTAQAQSEPSSEDIHMSLDGLRRPAPPSRRFPSQRHTPTPAPATRPHQETPAPVAPASPAQDHREMQDSEPEVDANALDHDADAEDLEAAEIAEHDAQAHQDHVEELDRETQEHQEDHERAEEAEHLKQSIRDTSGSSNTSAASSGSAAASSAPEAHPQRDEPDDGEHTESVVLQAEPAEELPPAEPVAPPLPDPVTVDPLLDPPPLTEPASIETASAARVGVSEDQEKKPWLSVIGSHSVDYEEKSFFSHSDEVTQMKKISRPMTDLLRTKIAAITGGEFAEKISAQALVTAFVCTKLGYSLDVDENTAKAMRAFAMMEPRLDAIEEHTADISRDIVMMADQMTKMNKKLISLDRSARSVELVQAYSFTDRVLGGLEGADDTAESIRLNAPAVQRTKTALRKEADAVLKQEQEREGRNMARSQ